LRFLHTAHANDPMQGWSGIGVGGRVGWRGAGGNMLLGDENREKKREREREREREWAQLSNRREEWGS
jgi:hypothetical protein